MVASAHKMCGPTGIGFLWGKPELLEEMPPWMGGGEMIQDVFLDHSTYAPPPGRFEAGTPPIAEAIGFGAACKYLSDIGMDRVLEYEVSRQGCLGASIRACGSPSSYLSPSISLSDLHLLVCTVVSVSVSRPCSPALLRDS